MRRGGDGTAGYREEKFMRLKSDIVTGNIDGKGYAITTGELANEFNGIINNNEPAAFIFELLKEDRTEAEVIEAMCQRYDESRDEIVKDVKEFLAELDKNGFIER